MSITVTLYEFHFYRRQLKKQDTFILQPLVTDRILQYKLKPNSSYLFAEKILYKINSNGLRDYEYNFNKEADKNYKIIMLGDSYTFGWGVEMQESYPKVLESLLNKEGYNVTVINAGIYGYNTQQEARYLKKEILNWCKPDLVIVSFILNDTRVQGTMPRHPYINHCESYTHFWFIEFIKSRINRLINKQKKIDDAGFAKNVDFFPIEVKLANPQLANEEAFEDNFLGWKRCKEALLDIKKLSKEKKFDLWLVIMPDFSKDFKNYSLLDMNEKVKKYCSNIGINTLDLFPYFNGEDSKKFQLLEISDTHHPNKTTHKIMGEIISERLKDLEKNKLEKYRN